MFLQNGGWTVLRRQWAIFACLLATPVWAQDIKASAPWVRGTVAGQRATGAFMELTATDNAILLGATSPVAGVVEVHEMIMDKGVMKMRALPKLDLPAGKTVALRPGSYHIMLMELKQALKKGEAVPITLKVEGKNRQASYIDLKAEVRDLTSMPGMDKEGDHKHMH
ncbi:MAG: copper chaperone PCu(A)C [Proteobacteria bacterium]|nr:copper chaperone PCu(A)C [Pseudomonadota bacterium]